jgi:hypothetical protein
MHPSAAAFSCVRGAFTRASAAAVLSEERIYLHLVLEIPSESVCTVMHVVPATNPQSL